MDSRLSRDVFLIGLKGIMLRLQGVSLFFHIFDKQLNQKR